MTDQAMTIEQAITSRRSLRKFLPTPIERQTIEEILRLASRAPSGTNMQPWKVRVVGGAAKAALSQAIVAAHYEKSDRYVPEYKYYPDHFPEPYKTRRRKVGWDLYGLLGIEKGDGDKMMDQHARNYMFFDAPVGMIFTIDKVLNTGSWLDYGMFLQNVMLAARGHGLHTCPQAAFAGYHAILREQLDIPETEAVVCGMTIGYADMSAAENTLETEREPVSAFTTFYDL